MARTPSTMTPLGTPAPDFTLTNVTTGSTYSLADFADASALAVMFICNHCPFVKHVQGGLVKLGHDYNGTDVALVAISSNDARTHPDDAPEALAVQAREYDFRFPYLYDETQEVAKAFGAACTPDFFVYDRDRRLVYRGQMDGSRPDNGVPVTGEDLRAAIEAARAGRPLEGEQRPSLGCNIKWKPGNEPGAA